ncbi:MAG: hypothetical protein RMY28_018985 [Nostoc sp. ChiSLP01]|nr:hypothetical protein [Nostoc sp. CmiSLP01]MDZ8287198.1 hypothetical protein [Nostoc sp. ChiSLP01]
MIASAVRRSITDFGGSIGAVFVDYLQQIPLESGGNIRRKTSSQTGQTVPSKDISLDNYLGRWWF